MAWILLSGIGGFIVGSVIGDYNARMACAYVLKNAGCKPEDVLKAGEKAMKEEKGAKL